MRALLFAASAAIFWANVLGFKAGGLCRFYDCKLSSDFPLDRGTKLQVKRIAHLEQSYMKKEVRDPFSVTISENFRIAPSIDVSSRLGFWVGFGIQDRNISLNFIGYHQYKCPVNLHKPCDNCLLSTSENGTIFVDTVGFMRRGNTYVKLSDPEKPYSTFYNKGLVQMEFWSNATIQRADSISIMPAWKLVNEGEIFIKDGRRGYDWRDEVVNITIPYVAENKLGLVREITSMSENIFNSGIIRINGASLELTNGFYPSQNGCIILEKDSQLILRLENYDETCRISMRDQKIWLRETNSAIFFGRKIYSEVKSHFAARIYEFTHDKKLIFQDKVTKVTYDGTYGLLNFELRMTNGEERKLDMKIGKGYLGNYFSIQDAPKTAGVFATGSVINYSAHHFDNSKPECKSSAQVEKLSRPIY